MIRRRFHDVTFTFNPWSWTM